MCFHAYRSEIILRPDLEKKLKTSSRRSIFRL